MQRKTKMIDYIRFWFAKELIDMLFIGIMVGVVFVWIVVSDLFKKVRK